MIQTQSQLVATQTLKSKASLLGLISTLSQIWLGFAPGWRVLAGYLDLLT